MAFGTVWFLALLKMYQPAGEGSENRKVVAIWLTLLVVASLSVLASGLDKDMTTVFLTLFGTVSGFVLGQGVSKVGT